MERTARRFLTRETGGLFLYLASSLTSAATAARAATATLTTALTATATAHIVFVCHIFIFVCHCEFLLCWFDRREFYALS